MAKPFKRDPEWIKAKKVCRLNQEDIKMAKELGIKPRSLIKNTPSPSQRWKIPVKFWIRELHERRFGRRSQRGRQHVVEQTAAKPLLVEDANLEREAIDPKCIDSLADDDPF
jgi:hypothetical protein